MQRGVEPYNGAPMDAQVVISAKWIAPVARLGTVVRGALLTALWGFTMLPCVCRAQNTWSGSIGGTSNYIYRGVSQTYNGAALQLGASYQSAFGWFAGAWGSNVDPY